MIPSHRPPLAALGLAFLLTLGLAPGAPAMEHMDGMHDMHDKAGMGAMEGMEGTGAMEGMDDSPGHGGEAHGDHTPKHGGRVLMYGDLHFEVVAHPAGGVELHLSDAMRNELPAVTVSDVTIEIERAGGAFEPVDMSVDDTGAYWAGATAPLDDPQDTRVHLAFVAFGDAVVYALPLFALQPSPPADAVADAADPDAR
jgi:hypothetical protein